MITKLYFFGELSLWHTAR